MYAVLPLTKPNSKRKPSSTSLFVILTELSREKHKQKLYSKKFSSIANGIIHLEKEPCSKKSMEEIETNSSWNKVISNKINEKNINFFWFLWRRTFICC